MLGAIAQNQVKLPNGGAEVVVWAVIAVVIVGFYLIIRRTRLKSRDEYMDQAGREAEMHKNDPDMKQSAAPLGAADSSERLRL